MTGGVVYEGRGVRCTFDSPAASIMEQHGRTAWRWAYRRIDVSEGIASGYSMRVSISKGWVCAIRSWSSNGCNASEVLG